MGEENRIHTVNMDSKVVERVERAACGGLLISVGLYDNRQILASLLCPVATHYLTGVLRTHCLGSTNHDGPEALFPCAHSLATDDVNPPPLPSYGSHPRYEINNSS